MNYPAQDVKHLSGNFWKTTKNYFFIEYLYYDMFSLLVCYLLNKPSFIIIEEIPKHTNNK